jgi:Flp pilus assembly pilin Flp
MWTELNRLAAAVFSRTQLQREEGQALIEYTLILALVSIAAITVMGILGTSIVAALERIVAAL